MVHTCLATSFSFLRSLGTLLGAAAFAAHSLPIARFPDAEHLYSATGLAPALYESATLRKRGRISRQGLAEHRDALMGIAWGLSERSPSFAQSNSELRSRGMAPIQARVALARNACRLAFRLLVSQQPFDEEAYRPRKAQPRTVTATLAMPLDGAT
jgi:transposase